MLGLRGRRGAAIALLAALTMSSCRSNPTDLPMASTTRVEFPDGGVATYDAPFGQGAPLGFVAQGDRATLMYSQGLFRVDHDGEVTDELRFDSPSFGVELLRSDEGTAALFVMPETGGQPARSRLVWVDDDVRVLLDAPESLALVGIRPEGVVVRNGPDAAPLSIVDWDGKSYQLGAVARDAALVPGTDVLVSRASESARLRATDIESGKATQVAGLPDAGVTFDQVVASPTDHELLLGLRRLRDSQSLGLWSLRVDGDSVVARRVAELRRGDILAGYADPHAGAVVRGLRTLAVDLSDGSTTEISVGADETPMGWSRTVLTLASLRPGSAGS